MLWYVDTHHSRILHDRQHGYQSWTSVFGVTSSRLYPHVIATPRDIQIARLGILLRTLWELKTSGDSRPLVPRAQGSRDREGCWRSEGACGIVDEQ